MKPAPYQYLEDQHCLIGEKAEKALPAGERHVTVELIKASPSERNLDFILAGGTSQRRTKPVEQNRAGQAHPLEKQTLPQ